VDTETNGLHVYDGRSNCIGVSIAYREDRPLGLLHSFYVGVRHTVGRNADEKTIAKLAYVLTKEEHTLVFANIQFDWFALETIGINVRHQRFWDIIMMANMINENYPIEKSLDNLAKHYLPENARKIAVWPWEAQYKLKVEKVTGWPNTTPEMMDEYACVDTELTLRILEGFLKDKRWKEIPASVWEHKQDFFRLLGVMRKRGIRTDPALCAELERIGTLRMLEINNELGLDLNKPGDKAELFLNRLKLPVVKTSEKTGAPSFDKFAMAIYEPMLERMNSPVAKLFKEYQGWKTAVTAMYRVYLSKVSPDGRLRTEFKPHITVTGRLSSANPNLQQIPKETNKAWSGRAKECFLAEEGWDLWNADFSQLELRVGTGYAKEWLVEVFADPTRDLFTEMTETFRELLAKRNPKVAESWSRNDTKTLVYSMQYGAGNKRVQNAFGVDFDTAAEIIDSYRALFPRFLRLNRAITLQAEATGQVKTWTGRVRHLAYESDSYKAMNSVIQGGSADIVERVMVRLWKEIDNEDECRILLTTHDSVVFEIKSGLADKYVPQIKAIMEDIDAVTAPDSFGVAFAVEIEKWKYAA
jgi:DNA polymerase-1